MAKTRTVELIAKLKDNISPGLQKLAVGAAAAGAAIVLLGRKAFAAAKELSDYGASIYDLASATGVAVEDVQALGYAFTQTGGSMDSMSGAIRGLNTFMRTAATGSAEYMNVLSDLGLEYDSLRAMEPAQAFIAITDAIGQLDGAMEKNIAATTVFGGRYAQQITGALDQADGSLRNLTDAFDASGNALTGGQIDNLKAYSDNLTDFDFATKKLTADVLDEFLPMMTDLMNIFITGGETVIGIADKFGGLKEVVKSLTMTIGTFMIVKVADMAINGQLTLSTGVLAAAKLKLAGAVLTAKTAMAGPAGMAAAAAYTGYQLVQLTKAIVDANNAMDANEEAMNRQSDAAVYAGDVLTAVMMRERDGFEVSDAALQVYINRLRELDDGSEEVAGSLAFLEEKLGSQAEALEFSDQVTREAAESSNGLDYSLRNLNQASRDARIATIDFTISQLQMDEALTRGPTLIAAQIAELQRYKTQLTELSETPEVSSGFTMPATEPEEDPFAEYRSSFAVLMTDMSKMAGITDNEMAQNFSENMTSKTEQMTDYYLAIASEEQALQDSLDKSNAKTEQMTENIINAALNGKDAWNSFWGNMQSKIIQTVATKGFMALLNFAAPGLGGAIGTVAGWLGFKGGGTVPRYAAAGGMTVPGSTSTYGDKTPIMAEPGEVVLSRGQANDLRGGSTVNNFSLSFPALISTASNAQIAQAVPVIKRILEKGNL